jgi:hypothetical protein
VLQKYVMDPLTFRGHKFDVRRLWANSNPSPNSNPNSNSNQTLTLTFNL